MYVYIYIEHKYKWLPAIEINEIKITVDTKQWNDLTKHKERQIKVFLFYV